MTKSKRQREFEHANDQAALFGMVLSAWSHIELMMEMIVQRELRLNLEETCIVCAPLGAGAKMSLMLALLNRNGEKHGATAAAFRELQNYMSRNSLAHGFMVSHDDKAWTIVSREVKTSLKVKSKSLDHYEEGLIERIDAAMDSAGITEDELDAYAESIAALEPHA